MALNDYKVAYDNTYEEVFNKVLVAKSIANMRYEPMLTFGGSVTRFIYDASAVRVRTVSRGSASAIDAITDSTEALTINLEKEAAFFISDGEVKQTGPLNPGEVIGSQIAVKVATDLDARVLAEVLNASQTFDEGDLTTGASTGTPITLDSTTVPKMVTRMPAKLQADNQVLTNMALVIDPYAASDLAQYLLGKQFDVVNSIWKNGYAGDISMAEVYVSNNLTASALFTDAGVADGETITINGVVFTWKTALSSGPAVAGEVLIGISNTTAIANMVALINDPATSATEGTALAAADIVKLTDTYKVSAVVTSAASSFTITAVGAGRLTLSDTCGSGAWTLNKIHAYYGKKGAIDLVVQDISSVDMRETSDRRGTNIFSSYLAGLKTFADGAKKFLNVKIAA
jgi:hypothetical protein